MAENNYVGHAEDPANRWYTAAGASAAGASNCALGADGVAAINYWAAGPFHAVGMLDPELRTVGFGSYRTSGGRGAAALNVLPSLRISTASDSVAYPVEWPGPGSVIDIGAYRGGELPNPLAGTGYSTPSGLPLIVQFGAGERTPAIYSSHLCRDGVGLAHRTYGEATYRNSIEVAAAARPLDPGLARRGRSRAARSADARHVPRHDQDFGGYGELELHGPGRAHLPDDAGHASHARRLR